MTEHKELVWHNCNKLADGPREKGWYLVKVYDLLNCEEPYEYSEPYYIVTWYDKYFDCDGIPVAWADISSCSFEVK